MKNVYNGKVLDVNAISKGMGKTLLTINSYEGTLKYLTVELLAHDLANITVETDKGVFTHRRYKLTHNNMNITGYRQKVGDPISLYRVSMDLAAKAIDDEGETERTVTVNITDDAETHIMTAEVVDYQP